MLQNINAPRGKEDAFCFHFPLADIPAPAGLMDLSCDLIWCPFLISCVQSFPSFTVEIAELLLDLFIHLHHSLIPTKDAWDLQHCSHLLHFILTITTK